MTIEESWENVKIEMLKANELVHQIYLQNQELIKILEKKDQDNKEIKNMAINIIDNIGKDYVKGFECHD